MTQTSKKPVKDIEDLQAALAETSTLYKSFRSKITGLGFDYQNKISGQADNPKFYELRDSIIYRLQSCQYLFHLLNKHQLTDESELLQYVNQKSGPGVILMADHNMQDIFAMATIERPCLFDSIIYHLTSTFDYIGGMTELLCGDKGRNRKKWNAVVKEVRDTNSRYKAYEVSVILLKAHTDFVDCLHSHRATIIHEVADQGGFEYELSDKSRKVTLHVFSTARFLNQFRDLKKLSKDYRVTLRYCAHFLMSATLQTLIAILLKLREDIERTRKIEKGKEILFGKDKNGNPIDISERYWT